jgi:hypothetical protein
MEENQSNFRFEKKFTVDRTRLSSVLYELKSQGFFKIFPNRIVNSIYYDDSNLSSFYENLDGLSERVKYRFRFYGNNIKNIEGTFERKIKSNDVNYKIFEKGVVPRKNIYDSKFPGKPNLTPNVHTNYERFYFYNRFKKIRCTIDINLKIYNTKNSVVKYFNDIIIEFKCDKKIPVKNVIKSANYNVRCSKYCIGVDMHNLANEEY